MRKAGLLLVAAVALVLPAAAQGKGASQASIEGPGLDKTLTISGNGETGGNALGDLAQQAGFFPAVFGQTPDTTRARRPAGELGPRYAIVWTMPGPNNETSKLTQDVYPYAKLPVTYMKPGQVFGDGQRTHGGWYAADSELRSTLVAVGLPKSAPSGGGASDWSRWLVAAFAVGALAVAVALLTRRTRWLRPEPAG